MHIKKYKTKNGNYAFSVVQGYRDQQRDNRIYHRLVKTIGTAHSQEEYWKLEKEAAEFILLNDLKKTNEKKSYKRSTKKEELDMEVQTLGEGEIQGVAGEVDIANESNSKEIILTSPQEIQRINDGIFEVFGKIYDDLGLKQLIEGTAKDRQWNDILKCLVLGRIAHPESKRKTVRRLAEDYATMIDLDKVYRAMDRISLVADKAQSKILEETRKLEGGEVSIVLFDVTTLYFESLERDNLRQCG
jgi:hypothetical protein